MSELRDVDWHIEQLESGTKDTELRQARKEWIEEAKRIEKKISSRPDAVKIERDIWGLGS